jgi:hypothetical protein
MPYLIKDDLIFCNNGYLIGLCEKDDPEMARKETYPTWGLTRSLDMEYSRYYKSESNPMHNIPVHWLKVVKQNEEEMFNVVAGRDFQDKEVIGVYMGKLLS